MAAAGSCDGACWRGGRLLPCRPRAGSRVAWCAPPSPPGPLTVVSPSRLASTKRRMSAGMTWLLVGWKLSPGPYRLVGITAIASKPCCLRSAWQALMPAILATAYHSLVGSCGAWREEELQGETVALKSKNCAGTALDRAPMPALQPPEQARRASRPPATPSAGAPPSPAANLGQAQLLPRNSSFLAPSRHPCPHSQAGPAPHRPPCPPFPAPAHPPTPPPATLSVGALPSLAAAQTLGRCSWSPGTAASSRRGGARP